MLYIWFNINYITIKTASWLEFFIIHQFLGIDTKYNGISNTVLISTANVKELHDITEITDGISVGAAVSIARLKQELETITERLPGKRY